MKNILIALISLLMISCSKETIKPSYNLSVSVIPSEGGSVSPSSGKFESGSLATITATPNPIYEFSNWTGSFTSIDNPLKLQIDSDKTLVANFKKSLDSDGDGIPDKDDMDNKTRKGVPVDSKGVMLNPIYLDKNGITIKCYDWSINGDKGIVNGKEYEVVGNRYILEPKIYAGSDLTLFCTSKIDDKASQKVGHLFLS